VSSVVAAREARRGGPATRVRAHTVLEALETATLARVGPATGSMTVAANFAGFDTLMRGYQDYLDLEDPQPFLRDHTSYKPVLVVPAFAQGPGDNYCSVCCHL
jgi:hypothetical protein